ncbi:MAG: HEPN domain-containing protein [Caloramator sp.]|nr:HEPN domain-containing protein [Caloramator sp.]
MYRLEKAKEDLKSAKVNLDNGLFKASINRSYYSIFHAIRAVNSLDEFDSKKHSGVIAHFNQYFIHTGKFDKEIYSIITSAYKIREKSDYDDFYIAPKEDAEEQLKNAEIFISKVESFLTEYFK